LKIKKKKKSINNVHLICFYMQQKRKYPPSFLDFDV